MRKTHAGEENEEDVEVPTLARGHRETDVLSYGWRWSVEAPEQSKRVLERRRDKARGVRRRDRGCGWDADGKEGDEIDAGEDEGGERHALRGGDENGCDDLSDGNSDA